MSLRGSNRLYKEVFNVDEQKKHRKGRSETLIQKRNECICDRYLFYGKYSNIRYEIIIEKLSNDFFLSAVTVVNIINENVKMVTEAKKQFKEVSVEKARKQLSEKWSHMVWNVGNSGLN